MSINKKQRSELEFRMEKWAGKVSSPSDIAFALNESLKDYKAVCGAESLGKGLAEWQAEVLVNVGLGAEAERERVLDIVEDVFENVPEDTVLGHLGAQIIDALAEESTDA
jgi:hypothetical protein